MPNISVTSVLLALNVAIFGLMLACGVDPMQPSIDSLIQWGWCSKCGDTPLAKAHKPLF